MPSVIAAFLGLLFSTLSTNPQALFSSQSVGALWAQAQTNVQGADGPPPSPKASAIALAYDPDEDKDKDNDSRHRHHYHHAHYAAPNPSASISVESSAAPAAAPTPGASLLSVAYPDATPIAYRPPVAGPSTSTAAADPASVPASSGVSASPVRTSLPTIARAYAVSPRWTPAPNQLPVYSSRFNAPNNPFHMTVAQLEAQGATRLPQTQMTGLWAQGYYNQNLGADPIYSSTASDPLVTVSCTKYGSCDANGKAIHVPSNVIIQGGSDHHLILSDASENVEFDGWLCSPPSGGALSCGWGGWYPFSGKGLSNTGSEGQHGGYAAGLVAVVSEEILQGHIGHALALDTECLSNPTVYPADTRNGSDQTCGGGSAPSYGALVHLKLTPSQIIARGYGYTCQVILNALSEYGAYTYDTGNQGLLLVVENSATYSGENPWHSIIQPQAVAEGDGRGSGAGFSWGGPCFGRLSADDFEVLNVPNLGY